MIVKLKKPLNLDADPVNADWIKGVPGSDEAETKSAGRTPRRFLEHLHPRARDGKWRKRGFTVVAVEPVPDLNKHVGKPWYGVDDWADVGVDLPKHMRIAAEYDRLPDYDESALPAYKALVSELDEQYDLLTNKLGFAVEVVDEDPYVDVHALIEDMRENKRIKVLATRATPPGHLFMSDEENDRFRAVHDAFGHAGTGRGFDRHGEEAAYQAHANMFSDLARRALATETRGQNAVVVRGAEETGVGTFPDQKFALVDEAFTKSFLNGQGAPDPDADNGFPASGSHHVSGGRWRRKVSKKRIAEVAEKRASLRAAAEEMEGKDFNPAQLRDPRGRWARMAGTVADAVRDMKLPDGVKGTGPNVDRLFGVNDVSKMFPNGTSTPTPWPHAARYRDVADYDPEVIGAVLRDPAKANDLSLVDPRTLHAYQPGVTAPGVSYYFNSPDYWETGKTFEASEKASNRYPIIYQREGRNGLPGQNIILSGHHRAAAALLKGAPLQAIVIKGGWGPPR